MQVDGTHQDSVIRVLEFIINKLQVKDLNWVLVGSSNLYIQGIKIIANDIDIISTKLDILKIEKVFNEYSQKKIIYSATEKYRSYFGKLTIENIQVELIAELEFKTPDGIWLKSISLENKKFIDYKGYTIPVNPLENELLFYEKMNRENDKLKIKLIKKHLEKE